MSYRNHTYDRQSGVIPLDLSEALMGLRSPSTIVPQDYYTVRNTNTGEDEFFPKTFQSTLYKQEKFDPITLINLEST